jgi:hypothetical protein
VLALGVIALLMLSWRAWTPSGPFWEKYQKVQFNMTEDEVKALLGPPSVVESPGGSLGDSCFAWFDGSQTIAVDFDEIGRMREKRFRAGRNSWWVHSRAKHLP